MKHKIGEMLHSKRVVLLPTLLSSVWPPLPAPPSRWCGNWTAFVAWTFFFFFSSFHARLTSLQGGFLFLGATEGAPKDSLWSSGNKWETLQTTTLFLWWLFVSLRQRGKKQKQKKNTSGPTMSDRCSFLRACLSPIMPLVWYLILNFNHAT